MSPFNGMSPFYNYILSWLKEIYENLGMCKEADAVVIKALDLGVFIKELYLKNYQSFIYVLF